VRRAAVISSTLADRTTFHWRGNTSARYSTRHVHSFARWRTATAAKCFKPASHDFRHHATGLLTRSMFGHHDRDQFARLTVETHLRHRTEAVRGLPAALPAAPASIVVSRTCFVCRNRAQIGYIGCDNGRHQSSGISAASV
jgi:hypothetical protein